MAVLQPHQGNLFFKLIIHTNLTFPWTHSLYTAVVGLPWKIVNNLDLLIRQVKVQPMERKKWVTTYIQKTKIIIKKFYKEDLKVIIYKIPLWIWQSEACTHRPSLSPPGEISRNIVDIMEIVSQNGAWHMHFTYTEQIVFYSFWIHNFYNKYIYNNKHEI